jgi:hypothetical protein
MGAADRGYANLREKVAWTKFAEFHPSPTLGKYNPNFRTQ